MRHDYFQGHEDSATAAETADILNHMTYHGTSAPARRYGAGGEPAAFQREGNAEEEDDQADYSSDGGSSASGDEGEGEDEDEAHAYPPAINNYNSV